MRHLKLSTPGPERSLDFSQFTGNRENRVGDWIIHGNDGVTEADAWVVLEGTPLNDTVCTVPDGMLFFGTAEVIQQDDYYLESTSQFRYLDQFDRVLTCHPILSDKAERHAPFLPWMINANHGASVTASHGRDLAYFQSLQELPKSKPISVICSTKTYTPEQILRLRFVERLAAKYSGHLDWFGNGVNSIAEKWDGLAPYRYTIAIENKDARDVITEKVQDAFLALALPVYWGAPNVDEYFDARGLVQVDIRDWPAACAAIDRLLDEDPYESRLPFILENKRRVLDEMHFLKRLTRAAEAKGNPTANRNIRVVRPESDFAGRSARYRRAAGRWLVSLGSTLTR